MLESGAPIYPLESKSVLRYSRKPKVSKMDELLLAEALAAINAPLPPMSSFGVVAKPLAAPVRDRVVSPPAPF
jgi:hypothetical protein